MINSVSNVLSFNDSNISANNNNTIYNLYDDNNSFAKMLDEAQNNEEIYSQSVTNKSIEKEEDYQNSLSSQKNNITDENPQNNIENTENIRKESIENNTDEAKNTELKESVNEEKTEKSEISENNSKENKHIENAENTDNNEIKKDIMSSKDKAKKLIDKAELIIENYKADKKAQVDKNINIDNKVNEEKLSSLLKDIENIKEELKNINLEELNEKDKKEIADLIIALESLEEIAVSNQNDDNNIEKLSDIFELVEVEDNNAEDTFKNNNIEKTDAKDIKDVKIAENTNDEIINNSTETIISNDDNIADKREMRLQEAKENANNNSNLNNTISDEKGSELTIINMKDASSSLKGYNHYNNVSKTQNTSSLAENMIRFQDLMSKLVEKAQVAVNNGKSEVLMSLNPEYLGKVRLKISMDADNNLVGKIFVDNAEIKDIFTKNLDTVISSLNEIGINIEGFDVMLRQDMPNENGEFEFGGNNNNLNGFGTDSIEEEVVNVQNYNIVPERKLNLLI